jgi:ParB-like chromosome segregation protein Spo0J
MTPRSSVCRIKTRAKVSRIAPCPSAAKEQPSQIVHLPIGTLRAHSRNARTHPKRQVQALARSIEQFGFTIPIIADENKIILAGHGRWLAAQQLKMQQVPVVIIAGLSDVERRAYLLADNKLAEKAGWDRNLLAVELDALAPLLAETGLDISLTGFEPVEIDGLMGDLIDDESDPADEPPPLAKDPISRPGDSWLLGSHRLLCGDARRATHYRKLMRGELAAMVFTDPPYNISIPSVQGRGRRKHTNFRHGFR